MPELAFVSGCGMGKSGDHRLITFYASADVPVFLLDCYSRGDEDNLTEAERNEPRTSLAGVTA